MGRAVRWRERESWREGEQSEEREMGEEERTKGRRDSKKGTRDGGREWRERERDKRGRDIWREGGTASHRNMIILCIIVISCFSLTIQFPHHEYITAREWKSADQI